MTVEIALTKGYTAIVDDADKDLAAFKWYPIRSSNGKIYATGQMLENGKYKTVAMHRVILERMMGRKLVSAELTDHVNNHETLNNCRSNLRVCDTIKNSGNRKLNKNNKSGYKGVTAATPTTWSAMIYINKVQTQLGKFATPVEAHRAYAIAALKHFGEFACLGETSPFLNWSLKEIEQGWKQLELPIAA